MALLSKKSPEERAEAEAEKANIQAEIRAQDQKRAQEKELEAFRRSPVGPARTVRGGN